MADYDITLANVYTSHPPREDGSKEIYTPLGCLYLISALEQAGIRVEFRDYQLFSADLDFPLDTDSFQMFLKDAAPIVGLSCMVSMLPFVLLGLKQFKEANPEHIVILGGAGPSGTAEAIVAQMPWVDIVVRGEGETSLVDVMRALENGRDLASIPGISYRDHGGIHHNCPCPRIKDLDQVAFPAYHRIDLSKYTNVSVVSGRGCPFRCTFCDVGPLWDNRVVLRSVDNVMSEIELLKSTYGRERINLVDDTFTLNQGRTESVCEAIERLDMTWSCLSRVDVLDEPLLDKMSRAGCDAIFLGIESGSNRVLKKINKKFTIQEATKKVEISGKYMDSVITSFIWGFPFESMDDFKLTMFSIVSMWYLDAMTGLMLLSPMPLSALGKEYRDQVDFSEELCSVFASLGNITPGMTRRRAQIPDPFKDFIRQYPDIFEGFYYIKSETIWEKARYLKKFCEKFGIMA